MKIKSVLNKTISFILGIVANIFLWMIILKELESLGVNYPENIDFLSTLSLFIFVVSTFVCINGVYIAFVKYLLRPLTSLLTTKENNRDNEIKFLLKNIKFRVNNKDEEDLMVARLKSIGFQEFENNISLENNMKGIITSDTIFQKVYDENTFAKYNLAEINIKDIIKVTNITI